MKPAIFHPAAREAIRAFPTAVKRQLGKAIMDLQKGHHLGMPLSRPMPEVAVGVEELRLRDEAGIYRTFYFKKSKRGILIPHACVKKTQKTPQHEIALARNRLKEMWMKNSKSIIARDARQLAAALGLTPADAVEMEVRSTLNDKIVDVVGRLALTHAQVAKLCETSRSRITAIMNRNTQDVSTDLLLRILARLGYRAKISFSKAA